MLRLILLAILFLLSLLTVFAAPTNALWYVSILITEFSWVFILISTIILLWRKDKRPFHLISKLTGIGAIFFFSIPIFNAFRLSAQLEEDVKNHEIFSESINVTTAPFSFWKMFRRIGTKQVPYKTMVYDSAQGLSLDFYPSSVAGKCPCVIVVHGGSWAGGDNKQLPELNSILANAGYHVAAINYRLAPKNIFPAPVEDVSSALSFLRSKANGLSIDINNFVLLGRSAGGQIVLSASDLLHDKSIKGVINFYGPADMVWGYANPSNPLVLDSKKVMEDYLGGTYSEAATLYRTSSATETANENTAPTLSIYGKNDPLVSFLHGKRLGVKLDSVHAKHYELFLPWATHGFDWTLNGPGGQISTWTIMEFLKSNTKSGNP